MQTVLPLAPVTETYHQQPLAAVTFTTVVEILQTTVGIAN